MPSTPRRLPALLDSFVGGHHPLATEISELSDLDRDEAAQLRERWPAMPAGTREDILARATELAEDNVDLNFGELGRIALQDEDAVVRRRAIAALWEHEDRATGTALAALARDDEDAQVRADATAALATFVLARELGTLDATTGDAIVETLRGIAGDVTESVDVRAGAVESLGYRSAPWSEGLITGAYYDDDRRLRIAAIVAMGRSADAEWLSYLEEDARSDDPQMRFEAARAFGAIGSDEAVDLLAELLEDEDAEVVSAALVSLGEIGGEEAARYLSEYIEDAEPAFQEIAEVALENARVLSAPGDSLLRL